MKRAAALFLIGGAFTYAGVGFRLFGAVTNSDSMIVWLSILIASFAFLTGGIDLLREDPWISPLKGRIQRILPPAIPVQSEPAPMTVGETEAAEPMDISLPVPTTFTFLYIEQTLTVSIHCSCGYEHRHPCMTVRDEPDTYVCQNCGQETRITFPS